MSKRWCFYIPVDAFVEGHGYVPSVVTEGEPGHTPMKGNGPGSAPWYWGKDYETAKKVAQKANADMGLSPDDALEIIASSMAASHNY